MNARWTMAALAVGALSVSAVAMAQQKDDMRHAATKDWPTVDGDLSNSRYSTLNQINAGNVKTLGGAWVAKFDGESSRGTPVVADGLMFVTAGKHVYALNPKTGETVWSYKPDVPASILFKGVAIGEGLVFVGTADAGMIALKEKTGELAWTGRIGDPAPPRDAGPGGADAAALTLTGQFISGAPIYAKGLVIAGMANGDFAIRGRVVALDAKTGKEAWRFNTIPGPGEAGHDTWPDSEVWKHGGVGVWGTPAADPDLGLVYFGTGNPVPQWAGEPRGGDNLYADTAVALDLKTGKIRWHYQVVHHDIWEADLGTPMVLYDAVVDGKPRKAIGVMRTTGELFLLDRATGKPVFPVEERPTPQNARLKTAPTQPFPVGADQIGPKCMEKDLIPAGFKPVCFFDPIDYDLPNAMTPLNRTRSAPMAFDPQTGYFYATAHVSPFWISRAEDPYVFVAPGNAPGMKSYGLITALDSKTDKIVWQKRVPYQIENGSGATATAGGLIFHGEPDGNLQAYDAKNGEMLWQFQTGTNESGPASIYEADGQEYVAVLATNALWSFKLGGTVQPLPAPTPPPTVTGFNGRIQSTDQISMNAVLNDMGLDKTRQYTDEYAFKPGRAKVKAGTKVTWTNTGKVPHDATAVDGSWTTGEVAPGQSASVTFDKPGVYTYTCKDHPWSYGELTVE